MLSNPSSFGGIVAVAVAEAVSVKDGVPVGPTDPLPSAPEAAVVQAGARTTRASASFGRRGAERVIGRRDDTSGPRTNLDLRADVERRLAPVVDQATTFDAQVGMQSVRLRATV